MKRFIAVCAASAVLMGCAAPIWSKPDGDNSQFEQDKAQCVYDVDLHTQNAPFNPFATRSLFAECMRARGYVS
jgi:hypothetical protein